MYKSPSLSVWWIARRLSKRENQRLENQILTYFYVLIAVDKIKISVHGEALFLTRQNINLFSDSKEFTITS